MSTASVVPPSSPAAPQAEYLARGTPALRRAQWALFAAGFSTFSLLYCVQPLMPLFTQAFGVSPAQSSLVLSLCTGLLAVAIFLVGLFSQALPRKRIMALSLFASAVLGTAAAVAPDWHLSLIHISCRFQFGTVLMTFKFRFAGPCREIPSDLDFREQRKACQRMGEKAGTDCSIELFLSLIHISTS